MVIGIEGLGADDLVGDCACFGRLLVVVQLHHLLQLRRGLGRGLRTRLLARRVRIGDGCLFFLALLAGLGCFAVGTALLGGALRTGLGNRTQGEHGCDGGGQDGAVRRDGFH